MGKQFSELSSQAQGCIVDAYLDDVDQSKVTESVKIEIREWATPDDKDVEELLMMSSFGTLTDAARFLQWCETHEHLTAWDLERRSQARELKMMCDYLGTWPAIKDNG